MTRTKPIVGLTIFTALAVAVTWTVFTTLRRDVPGPTSSYVAVFTDASGLHPGDDVRIAGVRVGRVDHLDLVDGTAKVTFQVQRQQTLFTTTNASVTYQNIIGQRYLGLSQQPGTPGTRLHDGSEIPLERTTPSFDIAYLLNGFEPLFSVLDPQQMDNLTGGLIQALQGDSGSLLSLITQTSSLAQTFAGPDDVLGNVITDLNTALTNLANQDANTRSVIDNTQRVISTLDDRRTELVGTVGSINATVGRLAQVVNDVYPNVDALLKREPGITGYLTGDGRPRISYLASNVPFLLKGLSRITQEGSYLNLYTCNLNSTIFAFLGRLIPAIVRAATPGGVTKQSAICR